MEGMVFVSLDASLKKGDEQNSGTCPNWELFCPEEYTLNGGELPQEKDFILTAVKKREGKSFPVWKAEPLRPLHFPEKEVGPDCRCPNKCFERIGSETVQKIFRDFWALSDYNSQNAYLFGLIDLIGVKRRYTKKTISRRNFTIVYHVNHKGQNVAVCKKAFLNIHGLQRNRGRINNLANKLKEGKSVPLADRRGRHANRPNAYSQEAIEHVRRHLLNCPRTGGKKNPSRSSKQSGLSAKRCYGLYVNEYCKKNEVLPVSLDKFRRVLAVEGYKTARKGSQKCRRGAVGKKKIN